MNPLIRAGIAAAVASAAVPAVASPLTKVQGDGFTLLMPGAPQKTAGQLRISGGIVETQNWTVSDDQGVLYSLSAADYPEVVVKARPLSQFIGDAKTGLVQQLKGNITYEKPVQLAGNSGIEFGVSSENGEMKSRSFLVGRRLYTLVVLYNPSIGAPQAEQFLTSLKLTG